MAKMFYSLEEAAEKLGISADEVQAKIEAGELSEFRSGDELVVKREQVDMLAGDTGDDDGSGIDLAAIGSEEIGLSDSVLEDDGPIIDTGHDSLVIGLEDSTEGSIGLADSGEPIGLADSASDSIGLSDSVTSATQVGSTSGGTPDDSAPGLSSAGLGDSALGGSALGGSALAGSGLGGSGIIDLASEASGSGMDVESPKDQTGISIFDDGLEDVDSSEATLVTDATAFDADASSSGSGLLDLTREGDDTSLGVDLLDDGGYGAGDEEGAGVGAEEGGALFESTSTGGDGDLAQAAPMMAFQEAYDGSGSGLVGGAALGIIVTMLFVGAIAVLAMMNQSGRDIIEQLGGTMNVGVGEVPVAVLAAAGVTLIGAIIGWVLGKRS